jgi:hypothetical protein
MLSKDSQHSAAASLPPVSIPSSPAFAGAICVPPPDTLVTDYAWAKAEAAKAGNLYPVLNDWRRRRKNVSSREWNPVLLAFQASRQTVLYTLSAADIVHVARTTEHALGDVQSWEKDLDDNMFAEKLSPTYAVVMLLHDLLESIGRVPTWGDFEDFLFDRQDLCLQYFMRAGQIPALASRSQMWAHPRMRAVRWRMANFYYSFLKEIHIIVSLRRTHGLDVRYHPLLDAEWKADFVCGDVRGELFFSNRKYRAATSGRKTPCGKLNPGLPVVTMLVEKRSKYGECWLYKDAVIAELAQKVREQDGPSIPSFILPS